MKKTDKAEKNHAEENAKAWMANILELFNANNELDGGADSVSVDGETYKDADSLRERVMELPLSVQVRGPWHNPGEDSEPDEFNILLTTGGPALRVTGYLGEHNEPENPIVEWQDWGTPWERHYITDEEQEALNWFVGVFYFGE